MGVGHAHRVCSFCRIEVDSHRQQAGAQRAYYERVERTSGLAASDLALALAGVVLSTEMRGPGAPAGANAVVADLNAAPRVPLNFPK